ncbi:MAG: hypothetical protein EZS28_031066 [Streblomastix strix]|uniref:Uncharacterized protein n=1 Tax=Streblomastix strix TaxID=222440 RepID=A0A5J4USM5_9EUKA|nr:MAG: hypothetical protein EZS28_031066 [Streblomastix strix]
MQQTIGVGIPNPANLFAQFDIGSMSSWSLNSEQIQKIKNSDQFDNIGLEKSLLPKQLYRQGSIISYSSNTLYGFTEESKDEALEYLTVNADFRVENELYDSYTDDG